MTNEDEVDPETSHTSDVTVNNESEPHLTQLLDAIDKAAQTKDKKQRWYPSYLFENVVKSTAIKEWCFLLNM